MVRGLRIAPVAIVGGICGSERKFRNSLAFMRCIGERLSALFVLVFIKLTAADG